MIVSLLFIMLGNNFCNRNCCCYFFIIAFYCGYTSMSLFALNPKVYNFLQYIKEKLSE